MSLLTQDPRLLSRFRAGERDSMELVFRHYAPALSALLGRGLATRGGRIRPASPFEIGALVQETFARAFTEKSRAAYDGSVDYLQYLAAIARNELLNQLRGREDVAEASKIEAELSGDAGATAVSAPPTAPDVAAEERELMQLVSTFLKGRDEKERDVYHARFEQVLTQEEAANALGLTRIQVRRVEAKLRRDLFTHLQASGYLDRAEPRHNALVAATPVGTSK